MTDGLGIFIANIVHTLKGYLSIKFSFVCFIQDAIKKT